MSQGSTRRLLTIIAAKLFVIKIIMYKREKLSERSATEFHLEFKKSRSAASYLAIPGLKSLSQEEATMT